MDYFCYSTYNKWRSRNGWGLKSPVLVREGILHHPGRAALCCRRGRLRQGATQQSWWCRTYYTLPYPSFEKSFWKLLWKNKPSWAALRHDFPSNAEYWRCFERGFYVVGCLCTVLITSVKAPMGSRESNAASFPRRDECCSLWYSRYGLAKGTPLPASSLLLCQDPQHLVKGRDKNLAHFLMVATRIRTEGERKGRFFPPVIFMQIFYQWGVPAAEMEPEVQKCAA